MQIRPARNRVAPTGEIVAVGARGAWTGNRGRLHEGAGSRDVAREYRGRAWITCRLEFRGRRIAQWHPNHYTPLFFADEAVALAAGHRPCAECRRADFLAFGDAWARQTGGDRPRAGDLDARLHAERLPVGAPRPTLEMLWDDVPVGAFVQLDGAPDGGRAPGIAVVRPEGLARYDPAGYRYDRVIDPPGVGRARVLTPPTALAALLAGYPVQVGAAG